MVAHQNPPTVSGSSDSAKRSSLSFSGRIGLRQLARVCHNLGTGLHAGVDVRRLLETEATRGSSLQRNRLAEIRDQVKEGESLAVAMTATGYFPILVCEMVDVGERTGRLEEVFFRLAENYDTLLRLKRNFLIGIAWPLIELSMGLLVVGALIWFFSDVQWNGRPMTVLGLSGTRGLMIYVGTIASIVTALAVLVVIVQKEIVNLDPLYRLLMNIPGIGTGFRTMAMARLTWALSMASNTDIGVHKTIELSVRSTQNSYYTSKIDTMKNVVRRGGELHDAFHIAGVFPDDFMDALQTGETAGRITETMQTMAKEYEERAKVYYKTLTVIAGVAVFLLVGAIMIFMIISLFTSLYLGPINDTLDSM